MWLIILKGTTTSPTLALSRLVYIWDTVMESKFERSLFSEHSCRTSKKFETFSDSLTNQPKWASHIGIREGQDQIAWRVASSSKPQFWQVSSIGIFLFLKFDFKGNKSNPALHIRILTLFGTLKLQMPFHNLFVLEWSKVPSYSFRSCSNKSRYLDLTE